MPSNGRSEPPEIEPASSAPMNGPTQANDASANVRPISSVPISPPFSDDWLSLRQKRRRNRDLKRAQQAQSEDHEEQRDESVDPGLWPSATTPTGPSAAVTSSPIPENSTMMPRQNITACLRLPCLFTK